MTPTALILEGGGMRGAFTAGVLDVFLERGLMLPTVYGVSAGACQACSYLCLQKGRAIGIWLKYARDKRFCGMGSWLKTGDYFNADFNYHQIPDTLEPIDNAAYLKNGGRLYAVVTEADTGKAAYLPVMDMKRDVALVQASSSLPLLSRPVMIQGKPYLDGGVADSIPLAQAIRDGYTRSVLVLTQPAGYRKQPNKAMPLIAMKYRRHPGFVEVMRNRHIQYNDTLDLIDRERQAGRAFVIRPDQDPGISRVERDPARLKALYDLGVAQAVRQFDALLDFLRDEN